MSTFAYYNISTTDVTTISAIDSVNSTSIAQDIKGSPKCITMCNKDASGDDCTIELYLENIGATSTVYILHDVIIPGGSTLILEQPEINFDSTVYALKFKLTTVAATQLVDIKIEY